MMARRGAVDCGATPTDLRRSTNSLRQAMEQKALRYTPLIREQSSFSSQGRGSTTRRGGGGVPHVTREGGVYHAEG